MKLIYSLFFLMFFLVFISCKEKKPLEKEPNNTFKTGNEIQLNSTVQGYVNSNNDRDFYFVQSTDDQVVSVNLSGLKGVNLAVKIWKYANTPVLLKMIDDNRKSSPEEFTNLRLGKDKYYFSIMHGARDRKKKNIDTPYSFTLISRIPEKEEIEPNDSITSPVTIAEGDKIKGYFSPRYNWLNESKSNKYREEDWYAFNVYDDVKLPVLVDIRVSSVKGVSPLIYLYGTDKKLLSVSIEVMTGRPSNITGIGLKEHGRYFVLVTTKGFDANNSEPYYLEYIIKEHNRNSELEPNNDRKTYNSFTNDMIYGKIGSAGDVDYFLFKTEGGQGERSYRIEASPDNEMDLVIKLYNLQGELLNTANNTGSGNTEVFPNTTVSGDFLLEVSSRSINEQDSNSYALSVKEITDTENLESESNDSKEKADIISAKEISGYISKKRDVDYYLIQQSSRVRYTFEITGVENGKLKVSVTDPLGYIIKTVEISGDKKKSITEMIDKKGYLIVESVVEDYNTPYTIILHEGK